MTTIDTEHAPIDELEMSTEQEEEVTDTQEPSLNGQPDSPSDPADPTDDSEKQSPGEGPKRKTRSGSAKAGFSSPRQGTTDNEEVFDRLYGQAHTLAQMRNKEPPAPWSFQPQVHVKSKDSSPSDVKIWERLYEDGKKAKASKAQQRSSTPTSSRRKVV